MLQKISIASAQSGVGKLCHRIMSKAMPVMVVVGLSASAAHADIAGFLNRGMPLSQAYREASHECGGQCDEQIASQLIALGYTANDVVASVEDAGGDLTFVLSSMVVGAVEQGASIEQVLAALLQMDGVTALDAVMALADAAQMSADIELDAVFNAAVSAGIPQDILIAGLLSTGADVDVVVALAEQAGFSEDEIDSGLELAVVLSGTGATAAGAQDVQPNIPANNTPIVTPSSVSPT